VPLREVPAVAAALVVACAVEVGVRTLPLPRLARLAGAPLRHGGPAGPPPTRPVQLGPRARLRLGAVRRVMRHWPYGDTCLRHALVAGHRIRRFGPELVVGVTKVEGEVRAHAWLEVGAGVYDPLGAAPPTCPWSPRPRSSRDPLPAVRPRRRQRDRPAPGPPGDRPGGRHRAPRGADAAAP